MPQRAPQGGGGQAGQAAARHAGARPQKGDQQGHLEGEGHRVAYEGGGQVEGGVGAADAACEQRGSCKQRQRCPRNGAQADAKAQAGRACE